jgi:hypothetical protein
MCDKSLKIHEKNKLCEYEAANPDEEEEEEASIATAMLPAVSLDEAIEAAATLGRFPAEYPDVFQAANQFSVERGVTAKLSKMMIVRLGQRVQQPLTAFSS